MDPNASFEELVAAVAERQETPTKAVGAGSRGRTKRPLALSPVVAAATAPGGAQQERKQYKRAHQHQLRVAETPEAARLPQVQR